MPKALVLFKPDVYERQMQEEITEALERLRLVCVEQFRVAFTAEGVFELWPQTWGWRWTSSLMVEMPKRPLDVHVLDGDGAMEMIRDLKDSLRVKHSNANSSRNLLHSSEGTDFEREYAYLKSIEVRD
jgi:nucleoside diphosphate kinase